MEYLGLDGLFSSILQVLNLSEFGFGTAIVYSMYKPIANKDTEIICALLFMYRKVYRVIGLVVLVAGLMISMLCKIEINIGLKCCVRTVFFIEKIVACFPVYTDSKNVAIGFGYTVCIMRKGKMKNIRF